MQTPEEAAWEAKQMAKEERLIGMGKKLTKALNRKGLIRLAAKYIYLKS